jgi:hypothetical protein
LAVITLDPPRLNQSSRAGRDRVLREKLGKKRIPLNNEQRRPLAVKGKVLGRKALQEFATM